MLKVKEIQLKMLKLVLASKIIESKINNNNNKIIYQLKLKEKKLVKLEIIPSYPL